MKEENLAPVIVNIFVPGVGQMMKGEGIKGIMILVMYGISMIFTLIPNSFYLSIFTENKFLDPMVGSLMGSISAGFPGVRDRSSHAARRARRRTELLSKTFSPHLSR